MPFITDDDNNLWNKVMTGFVTGRNLEAVALCTLFHRFATISQFLNEYSGSENDDIFVRS